MSKVGLQLDSTIMDSSNNTNSPMLSNQLQHPSSTVYVGNFVSSKLRADGKSSNYSIWKEQMLCLIESQDLLGYIDGKITPPTDHATAEYAAWRRTDRLLKGWILGAILDENALKSMISFHTAREVWVELGKKYGQSKLSNPLHPPLQHDKWHEYLPLFRATLAGDWGTAKGIFDSDPNAIKAEIAFTQETALHIAVGTGRAIDFVQKLVDLMPDDLLCLKDELGFTPLHVAARTGNTAAAKILVRWRPDLLYIESDLGRFPVHLAAISTHRDTFQYLISETKDDVLPSPYVGEAGVKLLRALIEADIFDGALYLADKYPDLARTRIGDTNLCALRSVAQKASAFSSSRILNIWERFIYSHLQRQDIEKLDAALLKVLERLVPHFKAIRRHNIIHKQAVKLVKCLCKHLESLDYSNAVIIYRYSVLTAAGLGIHEVIEEIVATFPAAIYVRDPSGQNIFHTAVQNRSEKVFNLIYQTSSLKHQFSDISDHSGNTLLHCAAMLAPSHKLNRVSGAALQMQREIQWFKEVEKVLHPYLGERTNKAGKTPQMVFTEEHKNLKIEGEKWMKDTANSCTIAAALIATVVFAAAITVPGGNDSNSGFPIFHREGAFIIFAVSDAISLFTSTTSLLMFLSILTSRYAEEDFLYALPKRLCIGLFALFVSISFMMSAFSATLYLVFGRKQALVLIPVAVLACLPVASFVFLQFPLLVDVVSSTYGRGVFGKQSNRPFY